MNNRDEQLQVIARKIGQAAELAARLQHTLLLQQHFPDAFAHGGCVTRIVGNPRQPKELRYVLRRGDGSGTVRLASEVPVRLWQDTAFKMLVTYKLAHDHVAARWYERKLDEMGHIFPAPNDNAGPTREGKGPIA